MKIALFFGSFNPIHVAHLIIAQTLLNEFPEIQKLWFVVSPQNPFKKIKDLIPETFRYEMIELAIKNHDKMSVSNVEFFLPKPSYTIDTLTHLSKIYPSYEFALLLGEDNMINFHKWKKYEVILKHYPIYVYPRRSRFRINVFQRYPKLIRLSAPLLDISATQIRHMIRAGKSCRFFVPDAVYEYIIKNNLYK